MSLSSISSTRYPQITPVIFENKLSIDDCLLLYQNLTADEIQKIKTIDFVSWYVGIQNQLNGIYNYNEAALDHTYQDCLVNILPLLLKYKPIQFYHRLSYGLQ